MAKDEQTFEESVKMVKISDHNENISMLCFSLVALGKNLFIDDVILWNCSLT